MLAEIGGGVGSRSGACSSPTISRSMLSLRRNASNHSQERRRTAASNWDRLLGDDTSVVGMKRWVEAKLQAWIEDIELQAGSHAA
jgi:hypothetical protein